ncbi:MAG: hypothetical protein QF898_06075 [SAR202 cluster bacterium]|jgi:hypothetical protein|nr:hypothetical protein [SAR202 cluster bacterium]MDP6514329.1 hypothetical protein [SAR202 cluster bacterium]MDP6715566.1 hypothetical protein [SAR202 cluster bacterium]
MIVIVCVSHKKSWFLSAHAENDIEAAGLDGHFNHQEAERWSSECEPRVLPVIETQVEDRSAVSESNGS